MRGKLKKEGHYTLFQTTKGNQILNLDDQEFFALVSGQKGDIIVRSDADHQKKRTYSEGRFYYVDFKNDPEFRDLPHLFLEDQGKFREMVLPEGFPTQKDKRKKLVRPKGRLPNPKVMEHVKGKGNVGSEKQYVDKAEGLRTRTREELYQLARKHQVKGRSRMSKEELVKHLEDQMKPTKNTGEHP